MMNRRLVKTVVAFGLVLGASEATAAGLDGASAALGAGTVTSYAKLDSAGVPLEIGVAFSAGALDGLPTKRNNTSRCFDLNGNGKIDATGECEGDYQSTLPFPAEVTGRDDIPFVFAMVDWNPEGHSPQPWEVPHFDIHFYQVPVADVEAIGVGSCGIFMDCAAFEKAVKPVPAKYVNADHIDVKAAVGLMGNHLIDSKTPEFGTPPRPFTHTWIFGAYDGNVIFHEVMSTLSFMTLGGDACNEIKQPAAWQRAGYYPTSYCFRHTDGGGLEVFMAGFVKRDAS